MFVSTNFQNELDEMLCKLDFTENLHSFDSKKYLTLPWVQVRKQFVVSTTDHQDAIEVVNHERKPSFKNSLWAVCGFRTEFFEKRQLSGLAGGLGSF